VVAENPRDRTDRGMLMWGIAGAGATAVLGGVALIVLDGRCKDLDPDVRSCPRIYDTKTLGVGALSAGAAAAGLAAYLYLGHRTHLRAVPTVAIESGGAVVGIAVNLSPWP